MKLNNEHLIADISDVLRNGKLCCPGCGKEVKILYVTPTKLSRCATCIGSGSKKPTEVPTRGRMVEIRTPRVA